MKKAKKNLKRYIAFLAVLIILVSITVTPAHAISNSSKQRMGAWLASALLAMNITISSAVAPYQDMLDYIPEQLGIYTPTWDNDYLDRSTIQVWEDYVEIDGVPYTDIWLSTDAAEKFRTDGFDFKTAYNLVSNSNGTFASGTGHIDGLPMFNIGGRNRTQSIIVSNVPNTYAYGNSTISVTSSGNYRNFVATGSNGSSVSAQKLYNTYPVEFYWYVSNSRTNGIYTPTSGTGFNTATQPNNIPYDQIPFDFDWVSGTIPADTPLPDGTGMMIRVPSDDINNWITDNPDLVNTPVEIDVTLDPDITGKIDDLIDLIIPVLADLEFGDIQFIENHTQPAPVINNLLPDTYKQEILQPITETINNQTTTIVENIPQIDEICQNIDSAPYNDLDTGLDKLPTVFAPFILDLRSALGIWHYVTEWLSQISTTFAFITGCLVGTSIMTPIYAAIAGFMCIKIYRRMTG